LAQRRRQAARLFHLGLPQAEVARQLRVSRVSAMRWYHAWKRRGQRGLAVAQRLGRPTMLSAKQLVKIEKVLVRGPGSYGHATDLWTLPRIAEVIEQTTGVHYHPGHVWKLLRQMGWSLQRPATQAKERDETAIKRWKKAT
jgi:transposase